MLLDHHCAKIVTLEQLIARFGGPRPRLRSRPIVLCHGVFDVVHPGHLRHLLYAKSKADVLVCSLTGDPHVGKGPHRPHVPQQLRAANLALLDIVDFVVINDAEEPSALIARLQPDFYAKGFEYSPDARPRPIREAAAVEAYGGEILFTPGDVVYSSSALIESAAPDLRWDKLDLLMHRADLSFDRLREIVRGMHDERVLVVGDTIVDALLYCEMIGANAKTPTVSVRRDRREEFVGGAAIVAMHARAACRDVQFATVLGKDAPARMVLDRMHAADVEMTPLVDRARPTTVKEAVIVDGYRLLKLDTVDNRPISDAIARRLAAQIAAVSGGSVIFSDFRHGIFNARTIPVLTEAIPEMCVSAADSQVASRWGNIIDFQGFDLITPNEREARFTLGDQDSGVRPLAKRLYEEARCDNLLMKMGARGVLAFGPGVEDAGRSFVLDAFADRIVDPVGAGDAFLAYATLTLGMRAGLPAAAILGSFAAGAECERDGNIPITPEHIMAKIDAAEKELQ